MTSTELHLGLSQAGCRLYPLKMLSSFPTNEIFPPNEARHISPTFLTFSPFSSTSSNHANYYLSKHCQSLSCSEYKEVKPFSNREDNYDQERNLGRRD